MKRTMLLLVALICLLVGGCKDVKVINDNSKETLFITGYEVKCMDGIAYYASGYGFLTLSLNRNGTVRTCN